MAKIWNGFFTFTFRALILNMVIIVSKVFTDMYTCIPWVCVSYRWQGVEQVINTYTQMHSAIYYKRFTEQVYKSSLHIKSSSAE